MTFIYRTTYNRYKKQRVQQLLWCCTLFHINANQLKLLLLWSMQHDIPFTFIRLSSVQKFSPWFWFFDMQIRSWRIDAQDFCCEARQKTATLLIQYQTHLFHWLITGISRICWALTFTALSAMIKISLRQARSKDAVLL